jgi:uncharacterized protein (TIGR03083 family)
MELYAALTPEQWQAPTVCAGWTVKDVASHLLDTDLRKLSAGRDGYRRPPEKLFNGYEGLVTYLNDLNQDWVRATRRLSPAVLMELQALSGPQVVAYWHAIDMNAAAPYGVAWAGEETSLNWFDCAREYTERWHHQQQIRDAVGAKPLTGRKWLNPILETFAHALPVAYRGIPAERGTRVAFEFTGDAGGTWTIEGTESGWKLYEDRGDGAAATVKTDDDTAWRIFTKGIGQQEAKARTQVEGRADLGEPFLRALAVIALRSEDKPQS